MTAMAALSERFHQSIKLLLQTVSALRGRCSCGLEARREGYRLHPVLAGAIGDECSVLLDELRGLRKRHASGTHTLEVLKECLPSSKSELIVTVCVNTDNAS